MGVMKLERLVTRLFGLKAQANSATVLLETPVAEDPQVEVCPTFTLRADVAWQRLALIIIWNHTAHPLAMPSEDRPKLEAAVGAFERWEETHPVQVARPPWEVKA